jgi:sugar/nucleoside kinase (ribokinase family)
MHGKEIDVLALGTCYIDTNVANFPFNRSTIIGEELIGEEYEVVPGGSAVNFCRLSSVLGLQSAFIGMVGKDAHGNMLETLLTEQGVRAALIQDSNLQTNIGYNITNPQGDHIMFVAGTANAALAPDTAMPKLKELLPETTVLYLGGCLKLKSFMHAFGEIIQTAKNNATTVAIDHGRVPNGVSHPMLEAVKGLVLEANYYFPSREEFCTLWGVPDIDHGLHKLQRLAPHLVTVVKDGANGAFFLQDTSVHHIEAQKVDSVVNATGAGDSFNAGVIAALQKSYALPSAIAYGCRVAAAKIKAEELPAV